MLSKIYLLCASVLLIQAITSQSIGNAVNTGINYNSLPNGGNYANGIAGPVLAGPGWAGPGSAGSGWAGSGAAPGFEGPTSTGGGFKVISTSSFVPTGVSVLAENLAIEGPLSVGGQMPFLGSVGFEGTLQAAGSGAVSYGCGNGDVGITSEDAAPETPGPYGLAFGSSLGNPGFGIGAAGPGFGASPGGPGFAGPGLSGPAHGPGLTGPGFGSGLTGPGFGNSLHGAGFGAGLAGKGLG